MEAAQHRLGPALTLAVPGSGKTTLLLERLRYLDSIGIDPKQILTLTFSRAAALDMKHRLKDARFPVSTIHAFSLELIRKTGTRLPQILKEFEQRRMLEQIMKQNLTDDDFESLSNEIGLLYNRMLKRDDTMPFTSSFPRLFDIATEYHRMKRAHDRIDYDDMLLIAKNKLQAHPALREALSRRFPYIQIDEAQDTSRLQFALIEQMLSPERNLFLVADDDQSIYGFRGAYPEYLLRFPERFPDAKMYQLAQNFRSDCNIVTAASRFISDNLARYPKEIQAGHPAEQPIALTQHRTILERNENLCAQIRAITEKGENAAVLFRNRLSALSVIDGLDRLGIAYRSRDGIEREFKHWIIRDLKAFMELALIPDSSEAFDVIWYKMNAFISKDMYEETRRMGGTRSMLSKAASLPFLKDYQIDTLERTEEHFAELRNLRPYDAIHFIEIQLGYLSFLSCRYEKQMGALRERLDALKAVAKYCMTAVEFFERIEELAEPETKSAMRGERSEHAAVTLTTVHGSKGLEFDHVFLIDVNPGSFPSSRTDDLEEERRLFYVAMTRAKKTLHLMHCEFVNGSFNRRSVFVDRLVEQSSDCLAPSLDGNGIRKPATG